MEKNLNIEGVELIVTAEESAEREAERLMTRDTIQSVIFLNRNTIDDAVEHERVEKYLGDADLILCAAEDMEEDPGETEGFYRRLFELLANEGVLLLSTDEEVLDRLKVYLQEAEFGMRIVAEKICSPAEDRDALLNYINTYAPKAVIAALPSPMQEDILVAHKDCMDVRFAVGIGEKPEFLGYVRTALLGIFKGRNVVKARIREYAVTEE